MTIFCPQKGHILGRDLAFSIAVAEEFRIALHICNNLSPSSGNKCPRVNRFSGFVEYQEFKDSLNKTHFS